MANWQQYPIHRFVSWNKKIILVQQIIHDVFGQAPEQTKLSGKLRNWDDSQTLSSKWLPYPFKDNGNIITIAQKQFSSLFEPYNQAEICPFIQLPKVAKNPYDRIGTVYNEYLLANGARIPRYQPFSDTIDEFENAKAINYVFSDYCDGELITFKAKDIIAILR